MTDSRCVNAAHWTLYLLDVVHHTLFEYEAIFHCIMIDDGYSVGKLRNELCHLTTGQQFTTKVQDRNELHTRYMRAVLLSLKCSLAGGGHFALVRRTGAHRGRFV